MQTATAPRHFISSPALPGAGLPHDRMARLAARQAFVTLKSCFLDAVATLPEVPGAWLHQQVRASEEPIDLWLLRAPVFDSLAGTDPYRREQRRQLRHALDTLFLEDIGQPSAFTAF
jgi:hypothetical protein